MGHGHLLSYSICLTWFRTTGGLGGLACQQEAGEDWEVDWEIAQEVKDWENEMEYCWMAGN